MPAPRSLSAARLAARAASAALVAAASAYVLQADSLRLRLSGDQLFVSAARIELLKPPAVLERLKNGSTVAFDFHLSLWVGSRTSVRRRAFERFVVSYDLWEEKFAVTNLRKPRASAAGLTEREVETWCLDRISLPAVRLSRDEKVWARLEIRAVDPRQDDALFRSEGVSVTDLVELISRPGRRDEPRWSFESGAVSAAGLLREAGK